MSLAHAVVGWRQHCQQQQDDDGQEPSDVVESVRHDEDLHVDEGHDGSLVDVWAGP